jgi:hypothetical protein
VLKFENFIPASKSRPDTPLKNRGNKIISPRSNHLIFGFIYLYMVLYTIGWWVSPHRFNLYFFWLELLSKF